MCRLLYGERTIAYMKRQRHQGLSKKDVIRCLKRFIAKEVINSLKVDLGIA